MQVRSWRIPPREEVVVSFQYSRLKTIRPKEYRLETIKVALSERGCLHAVSPSHRIRERLPSGASRGEALQGGVVLP